MHLVTDVFVLCVFICFNTYILTAHRFVLNGVTYPNGSTVLRTVIGEEANALQCTTDRADCCRGGDGAAAGHFYFPNGEQVPILGNDASIRTYYRNRGTGFIRLNRRSVATETGQFRCEIPDASGTLVNLFINIGMFIWHLLKRAIMLFTRTEFISLAHSFCVCTSLHVAK